MSTNNVDDLSDVSAGQLADYVRVALRSGQAPYTPLNPVALRMNMHKTVEPGRLDARLADYYRVHDDRKEKVQSRRRRDD